ncbi:MAG: hypothetical protein F4046_10425 [Acidimicrobiaceae bacterium]|nr:hypothetical protein [Acidimicrobiaceae bacterium]
MAAVAGLAALAVVLVQNVVSDTSEQIEGSSARQIAAQVAAQSIVEDARIFEGVTVADSSMIPSSDEWDEWVREYTAKCNRLSITYADAGISASANFQKPAANTATYRVATADSTTGDTKANLQCTVSS